MQDATAWPHLNVLGMGYACLIQVELARGEWSLAELALHDLEQLVERERYWIYSDWLLTLRAQWWLAQGQLKEASIWMRGAFFPEEPEGYLRVYLDEGEPMKETLQALLTPHSQQHEWTVSLTASIAKLLTAFEQEQSGVSRSREGATLSEPALSLVRQPSVISSASGISFTRREQEVLRLLASGTSNQDIAQTLVISLDTVKKYVSHLLGKLGVSSCTQAVALARAHSLL